ncbi:MAG: Na-translocating system protein MpsC family protein [Cyanobacteria bacterium P01_D01_bin.56]
MKKRDLKRQPSVEKFLEKEIETLVGNALGQCPTDVSCVFISSSDLVVLVDNVKTPLEDFLTLHCQPAVLQNYRRGLKVAIGKKVQKLVETTIEQPIGQISMSRQTETRWMGIFSLV